MLKVRFYTNTEAPKRCYYYVAFIDGVKPVFVSRFFASTKAALISFSKRRKMFEYYYGPFIIKEICWFLE